MNIFVTDTDPYYAARNLDNKRVIKMILESAQMLSTAITLSGGQGPYKVTHANHPCSIWARTSRSNYKWLYNHYLALMGEYTVRYGKVHKCNSLSDILWEGRLLIPDDGLTPFANCARNKSLGLDFTHIRDVVTAYKQYLAARNTLSNKNGGKNVSI